MEVKLEIVRTIEVSTMIAAQTQQNQVKQKNEAETGLKKVQSVQLETSSLYLSYNKLTSIKNFYQVIPSVFPDLTQLKWIDLSHNRLVILDYVQLYGIAGFQGDEATQDTLSALQLH